MARHKSSPDDRDMDMIGAYLKYLEHDSATEVTLKRRREVITQLNHQLKFGVGRTCRDELERWLHNPNWSQNTKATYFSALRSAYAFWADPKDPWISEDPTLDMAAVTFRKGIANPVEDAEPWTILDRAAQPYRLWALIAAYQGLRCIEISGLYREHVTEQKLFVVRGKGGKPRVHDTDPLVWEAIRDLPPGPVARDVWGRDQASAPYISRMASHHFQVTLGLTGVTMHRFRHWLGVTVQAAYKDVRVTQELLGHESLSSTQIYTRATLDQQRAARAMLPRPGVSA